MRALGAAAVPLVAELRFSDSRVEYRAGEHNGVLLLVTTVFRDDEQPDEQHVEQLHPMSERDSAAIGDDWDMLSDRYGTNADAYRPMADESYAVLFDHRAYWAETPAAPVQMLDATA